MSLNDGFETIEMNAIKRYVKYILEAAVEYERLYAYKIATAIFFSNSAKFS